MDPQIYPEDTHLQDPGPEANLIKFDYLISYLARGNNVTIANNCIRLDRRLKTACNSSMSSVFLVGGRRQLSVTLQMIMIASS